MDKKSFLDEVCAHIRAKRMHGEIRAELSAHIDDLTEEFCRRDGMDRNDAQARAVSEMGDGAAIGSALDRQHRPHTDFILLAIIMLTAVFGAVGMYFCGGIGQGTSFGGYMVSAVVGIAVFFAVFMCDYSHLVRLSLPVYLFSVICLLYIIYFGLPYNGVSRFFRLGPAILSADITIPLIIAGFCGICTRFHRQGAWGIIKLLVLGSVPILITMSMPYMRLAILLCVCFGAILITASAKGFFGGCKRVQVIVLSVIILSAVAGFLVICRHRIFNSDFFGGGYQAAVADFWLKNSAFWGTSGASFQGVGIGESLPAAATDYALVTIIATLGKAAGGVVILLAALLSVKMLTAAAKIRDCFGFLLVIGAAAAMIWQFACGILTNFGALPVLYYGIPFISYGGTSYIVNMALAGLIMSVCRRRAIIPAADTPFSVRKRLYFENGRLILDFTKE